MKNFEDSSFATFTIIAAQILSGIIGGLLIIGGIIQLGSGLYDALVRIAAGTILLGAFFAFARLLNLEAKKP